MSCPIPKFNKSFFDDVIDSINGIPKEREKVKMPYHWLIPVRIIGKEIEQDKLTQTFTLRQKILAGLVNRYSFLLISTLALTKYCLENPEAATVKTINLIPAIATTAAAISIYLANRMKNEFTNPSSVSLDDESKPTIAQKIIGRADLSVQFIEEFCVIISVASAIFASSAASLEGASKVANNNLLGALALSTFLALRVSSNVTGTVKKIFQTMLIGYLIQAPFFGLEALGRANYKNRAA